MDLGLGQADPVVVVEREREAAMGAAFPCGRTPKSARSPSMPSIGRAEGGGGAAGSDTGGGDLAGESAGDEGRGERKAGDSREEIGGEKESGGKGRVVTRLPLSWLSGLVWSVCVSRWAPQAVGVYFLRPIRFILKFCANMKKISNT